MAMKLYTESSVQNIADAIRLKNGLSSKYTISQMAQAVRDIPLGGNISQYRAILDGTISGSFTCDISIVGAYAFVYCSSLTSVSFPKCTTIGEGAFQYCSRLATVDFPQCKYVGNSAFYSCTSLTTVSFPECSIIGQSAFQSCRSLTSISFPVCTMIGDYAFQNCSMLTSVTFPECDTILGLAFQSCSRLNFIDIPKCSDIYNGVFKSCLALSKAIVGTSISVICNLSNSSVFQSTPIAQSSYLGYFGSIYVPSSLLTQYQTATN